MQVSHRFATVFMPVVEKSQLHSFEVANWTSNRRRSRMAKPSDGAKKLIGNFSPKLVELTDQVLFDDIWERKELSKRDRSLVTVAALIALNRPDQLRFHLGRAIENGVKKEELIEAITHLAFYSGWPNAMTAVLVAKEVFEKT
jgi:4-carboxymuconolactone decarboxylase